MNDINENIRALFKEKLEQHQTPVDDMLWESIQSTISNAGAASASGAGSSGFFGGLSTLTKIAATIIISAAVVTAVIVSLDPAQPADEAVVVVAEKSDAPVANKIVTDKPEIEESDLVQEEVMVEEVQPQEKIEVDSNFNEESNHNADQSINEQPAEVAVANDGTNENKSSSSVTDTPVLDTINSKVEEENEKMHVPLAGSFAMLAAEENYLDYQFSVDQPGDAVYTWTINDEKITGEMVHHVFEEPGDYEITLTAQRLDEQKVTRKTLNIIRPSEFQVQNNIISPSRKDGINDIFDIEGQCYGVTIDKLVIFDEQGTTVFESSNEVKIWDGTDPSGSLVEAGTYFYTVSAHGFDGKTYKKAGPLTVN